MENIIAWIIIGGFFLVGISYVFFKIRDRKLLKSVTKLNRGTKSERDLVLTLLKNGIPAEAIFHDLYLRKYNDYFSQIDLVVVTKVGVVVLEVKDYSGWLYGTENQTKWTQVLDYGRRIYNFYNPLMQNKGHIEALRKQLETFGDIPFYSIIVFYGNCQMKTTCFVPKGTYLIPHTRVLNVMNMILNDNKPALYRDKDKMLDVLRIGVQNGGNKEIQKRHIQNIRNMLG